MNLNSYIQWYNENEGRAYPVSEAATRTANNGLQLPDNIIVDLGILVPYTYRKVRLHGIHVTPQLISVAIESGNRALFVCSYVFSQIEPFKAYPLTPAYMDNISGWIAFGTYRPSQRESYFFTSDAQSAIESRCINIIDPVPVVRLSLDAGTSAQYVDGMVKLVAGPGVTIRQSELSEQTVLIGLTSEAQVAMTNKCNPPADKDICGAAPMRSINGVCPDANGKLTIEFT